MMCFSLSVGFRSLLSQLLENLQGSGRQWHAILLSSLHTLGRDKPELLAEIDLAPTGAYHLSCATGRQDREFECLALRQEDFIMGHFAKGWSMSNRGPLFSLSLGGHRIATR
jgi:hypothetical protein